MKIQVSSGKVYEMKSHKLSGKKIDTDFMLGKVLGIRADAKSARERFAFIVQLGPLDSSVYLMSRVKFTIVEEK